MTRLGIVLGILCSSSLALAQAKTEKPAAKPAAPAMELPKPPAELETLMKNKTGNWKCDEKAPETPMNPAHEFKAKLSVKKSDLEGFWYLARFEEMKSKDHPINYKADDYWGVDPYSKKWTRVWVDNLGGWASFTGTLEGTKIVWVGEALMFGKKTPIRHTIDFKSDKEMADNFEMQMNGKWMSMGAGTCKK